MFGKNYCLFFIIRLFVLFREVEGHKGTLKNAVNLLNAKLERPKCHISKTEARREIILHVTVEDAASKDGESSVFTWI